MGKCSTEKFIEKAKSRYGDKYDYSKVEYSGYNEKVCIICSEHGEFWQTPDVHLHKNGCPKCGLESMRKKLSKTTDKFIEEARTIHGDKYDYSKVDYIDARTKVCIICPEHGEFWQEPSKHITGKKSGCPKCAIEKMKDTRETFIEKAKKIHGDKYDYSLVEYSNSTSKVCIICPKHGKFFQTPNKHLSGEGCYYCGRERTISSLFSNTEEFVKKAKEVHGNKYDYSKTEYIHNQKKVCIICPEHGEFWMTPNNHIGVKNKCGCPICNMSKLELFVLNELKSKGISYIRECSKKNLSWLGRQRIDFYVPSMNMAIECQGIQHFLPVSFGSGDDKDKSFERNIKSDVTKFNKCTENGIKVIYIVEDKKIVINNVIYKYNNVYTKDDFNKVIENED